jgi:hypothetical protein
MIASRAVKVYTVCRRTRESYVTTVFSPEDADAVGSKLSKELGIVAVRYRDLSGKLLSTLRKEVPKTTGRPLRRIT